MKKIRGQVVYSIMDRLVRKRIIDPKTNCWNWTGVTYNGYGRMIVGSRIDGTRRTTVVHRVSFVEHGGIIGKGHDVCHHCDNRKCFNPKHLFSGTRKQNVDDMMMKGRNRHPIGEQFGMAKLTDARVTEARSLRASGFTFNSLAARYGTCKKTIMQAVKGQTWKHVPSPPLTNTGK